ncbi:hypothetical protein [Streptomyces virginiae]|nr:hypothetical protein [Streptomyces virginiae]WSC75444.1 hypothetical protein OHA56_03425 [Streptomyces virginiae]
MSTSWATGFPWRGPRCPARRLFGSVNRLDPVVSALLLVEEVSDEEQG